MSVINILILFRGCISAVTLPTTTSLPSTTTISTCTGNLNDVTGMITSQTVDNVENQNAFGEISLPSGTNSEVVTVFAVPVKLMDLDLGGSGFDGNDRFEITIVYEDGSTTTWTSDWASIKTTLRLIRDKKFDEVKEIRLKRIHDASQSGEADRLILDIFGCGEIVTTVETTNIPTTTEEICMQDLNDVDGLISSQTVGGVSDPSNQLGQFDIPSNTATPVVTEFSKPVTLMDVKLAGSVEPDDEFNITIEDGNGFIAQKLDSSWANIEDWMAANIGQFTNTRKITITRTLDAVDSGTNDPFTLGIHGCEETTPPPSESTTPEYCMDDLNQVGGLIISQAVDGVEGQTIGTVVVPADRPTAKIVTVFSRSVTLMSLDLSSPSGGGTDPSDIWCIILIDKDNQEYRFDLRLQELEDWIRNNPIKGVVKIILSRLTDNSPSNDDETFIVELLGCVEVSSTTPPSPTPAPTTPEYCMENIYDIGGLIESQTLGGDPLRYEGCFEINPNSLTTQTFTTTFSVPITLMKLELSGGALDPDDVWEIVIEDSNGIEYTFEGKWDQILSWLDILLELLKEIGVVRIDLTRTLDVNRGLVPEIYDFGISGCVKPTTPAPTTTPTSECDHELKRELNFELERDLSDGTSSGNSLLDNPSWSPNSGVVILVTFKALAYIYDIRVVGDQNGNKLSEFSVQYQPADSNTMTPLLPVFVVPTTAQTSGAVTDIALNIGPDVAVIAVRVLIVNTGDSGVLGVDFIGCVCDTPLTKESGMEVDRVLSDNEDSDRSQLHALSPWVPSNTNDFMEVVFSELVRPSSVLFQIDSNGTRVTSFTLFYLSSSGFEPVYQQGATVFQAGVPDSYGLITVYFYVPVPTTSIRIGDFTFSSGERSGVRAEIYGCEVETPTPTPPTAPPECYHLAEKDLNLDLSRDLSENEDPSTSYLVNPTWTPDVEDEVLVTFKTPVEIHYVQVVGDSNGNKVTSFKYQYQPAGATGMNPFSPIIFPGNAASGAEIDIPLVTPVPVISIRVVITGTGASGVFGLDFIVCVCDIPLTDDTGMEASRTLSSGEDSSKSQIGASPPWNPTSLNEYMEVIFSMLVQPSSVLLQCDSNDTMVTSFKLYYRDPYGVFQIVEEGPSDTTFNVAGPLDSNGFISVYFYVPEPTTAVRIGDFTHSGEELGSVRAEFYGCLSGVPCVHEGRILMFGETIPNDDPCIRVICGANGIEVISIREYCNYDCEGTLVYVDDKCCPTCVPPEDTCQPRKTTKIVTIDECIDEFEITYKKCLGYCISGSVLKHEGENQHYLDNHCLCCRPIASEFKFERLECESAAETIKVESAQKCECLPCEHP